MLLAGYVDQGGKFEGGWDLFFERLRDRYYKAVEIYNLPANMYVNYPPKPDRERAPANCAHCQKYFMGYVKCEGPIFCSRKCAKDWYLRGFRAA